MSGPPGVSDGYSRSPLISHSADIQQGPSQQGPPQGPPYAPQVSLVGGIPDLVLDIPICVALLATFIGGAAGHMATFQLNKRKGHKFIFSVLMFGFCMARITTMVMRIVWATRPNNIRISIAAQIFTSAGVVILFVINLIFAQRILRATHPRLGWHKAFSIAYPGLYALIIIVLIMVIVVSVQTFYTLNSNTRYIDRNIQLAASCYFVFVSFLPIPLVILGILLPRKSRVDKFGIGLWRAKVAILLSSAVLLCLGAAFRCGTAFLPPRHLNDPAWYHAKWCYYFFNFILEVFVIYLYLIVRVDQRFHVPDGSKQPGDYSVSLSKKQFFDLEERARPGPVSGDGAAPERDGRNETKQ